MCVCVDWFYASFGYRSVCVFRDERHVALKILSAHATGEIDAGRLRELTILRTITAMDDSHPGHAHVVHLLHEFTFDSFYGKHICFVTDVLSLSVTNMVKLLGDDPRLPLRIVLLIVKQALKALEYLHDSCGVVHAGTSKQCVPATYYLTKCVCPLDLKPSNILIRPSNVDQMVMHELTEYPAPLYTNPKTTPPHEMPFDVVASAPMTYIPDFSQGNQLHWVIADFGHCT